MKQIKTFICLVKILLPCLVVMAMNRQVCAQADNVVRDVNWTTGSHVVSVPGKIIAPDSADYPVEITDSAQADFTSGSEVTLKPGFHAGASVGGGYFDARIDLCNLFQTSATITNVGCDGSGVGSAIISAGGGTPPYDYLWSSGGGTNSVATGLTPGTYMVSITDAHGCSINDTIVILPYPGSTYDNAITINPDSVSADFVTGDSVLWFKFVPEVDAAAFRLTKPLNTNAVYAQLQSAGLYVENPGNSLSLLGEWKPALGSDIPEINIDYSHINSGFLYYLKVNNVNSSCASFALAAEPAQSKCGKDCDLIGEAGDFVDYTPDCPSHEDQNIEDPFSGCVTCWQCSHGTPQMGYDDVEQNYYALMWEQPAIEDVQPELGEGIAIHLSRTIVNKGANDNVAYVFHMRYRLDSQTNFDPTHQPLQKVTIYAALTDNHNADKFTCGGGGGMPMPSPTVSFPITVVTELASDANVHDWRDAYACINTADMPEGVQFTTLWIHPVSTNIALAWINVDNIHVYKIDANLVDANLPNTICSCQPVTLNANPCSFPLNSGISSLNFSWNNGATGPSITINAVSAAIDYTVYIDATYLTNKHCIASDQVTLLPSTADVCIFTPVISPTPKQICSGNDAVFFEDDRGTAPTNTNEPEWSWSWGTDPLNPTGESSITGTPLLISYDNTTGIQYSLTLTETNKLNGCTGSATLPPFHWYGQNAIVAHVSISCIGDNQYQLIATPNKPTYTYQWYKGNDLSKLIPGATSSTFTVGTNTIYEVPYEYTVAIDDAGDDCTGIKTVSVDAYNITFSVYKGNCMKDDPLTATISPSNINYKFDWSPSPGTVNDISNNVSEARGLNAVTYTLTATAYDDNNELTACSVTKTINISNEGFRLDVSSKYADCSTQTPGKAIATVSGGVNQESDYHFLWSPTGETTSQIIVPRGEYTVAVTAGNCSVTKTVHVADTLGVDIKIDPPAPTICSGQSVTLNASGAAAYSWDPSTGLDYNNMAEVIASPAITTIYTVTGTYQGCTGTKMVTVTVNPAPSFSITSTEQMPICSGNQTTLSTDHINVYSVIWSNSSTTGTSTAASISAPPSNGSTTSSYSVTYSVTATANSTAGGCSSTHTYTVMVNPTPNVSITNVSPEICKDQSSVTLVATGADSYDWSPHNGLDPPYDYYSVNAHPSNNNNAYTVTGKNDYGNGNSCASTATVAVTVHHPPDVNVYSSSPTICNGGSTLLTVNASNIESYSWSPTTGISATSIPNVFSAHPTTSTTYILTVTADSDHGSCTNTYTVTITVNQLPDFTLPTSPISICSPATLSATPTDPSKIYSYQWATDVSTTTGASIQAILPHGTTTTYTVTATKTSTGCSSTQTLVVNVDEIPCCSNGLLDYLGGALSPGVDYNINQNIAITGDIEFNNNKFYIKEGVSITVGNGAGLHITKYSDLKACDDGQMWRGIIHYDGFLVVDDNSIIEDAQFGIESSGLHWHYGNLVEQLFGGLALNTCTLKNDYIGVYIHPITNSQVVMAPYIKNCHFISSGTLLKDGYDNQDPPVTAGSHPFAGIMVRDMLIYSNKDNNYFDNLNNGIFAINSNLYLANGTFTNISRYDLNNKLDFGAGIFATGKNYSTLIYDNGTDNTATNFDYCDTGIVTFKMANVIRGAKMDNIRGMGISVGNPNLSSAINNNDITIVRNGVEHDLSGISVEAALGASTIAIDNNTILIKNPSFDKASDKICRGIMAWPHALQLNSSGISGNKITVRGNEEAYGIDMSWASSYSLAGNCVKPEGPTATNFTNLNNNGIKLQACSKMTLDANYISGNASTGPANKKSTSKSIITVDGNGYTYKCNTIDNASEGFYFDGTNNGTLQTNNIGLYHSDGTKSFNNGLHITSNSGLGQEQYHTGNLWLGTYKNLGALHKDISIALSEKIKYNSSNSKHLTSFSPPGWFTTLPFDNDLDCPNNCSINNDCNNTCQ